jgi:hypothetical protein
MTPFLGASLTIAELIGTPANSEHRISPELHQHFDIVDRNQHSMLYAMA